MHLHSVCCLLVFFALASRCEGDTVRALLVGVTQHSHLPGNCDLAGPANDVKIFRRLLTEKFNVAENHIVVLAQAQPVDFRPTKANIEREFRALIENSRAGDHVVILMSGHGSRDIDDDPDNENDIEIDGYDEIFLPSDAKQWNRASGVVENAIRDDEIREWIGQIRARGATVFFVGDTCHSESQTRGVQQPRTRGMELLPEGVRESTQKQSMSRGGGFERSIEPVTQDGIAAFYACQASEETPDHFIDPITGEPLDAGLLTYTICQILETTNRPITYRELGQRIRWAYSGYHRKPIGANVPTPMFEGDDLDREILGSAWKAGRSRIIYSRKQGQLFLSCSSLDGTLPGTILRMFPLAGEKNDDQPLGWAKIIEADLEFSIAIQVEYDEQRGEWRGLDDVESEIPDRGRCEIHSLGFGPVLLDIALDESADLPEIHQALDSLREGQLGYIRLATSSNADFRLLTEVDSAKQDSSQQLVLERVQRLDGAPVIARFDLGPVDNLLETRLKTACVRILKSIVLTETAYEMQQSGWGPGAEDLTVDVSAEILETKSSTTGQPMDGKLYRGKFLRLRVQNQSRNPVRAFVFYLGDDYGVTSIFPATDQDNVLLVGDGEKSRWSRTIEIENTSKGLEQLVVIITPVDETTSADQFRHLSQSALSGMWLSPENREDLSKTRGKGVDKPSSRLAQLLEQTSFQLGSTRGALGKTVTPSHAMRVISWQSVDEIDVSRSNRNSSSTSEDLQRFRQGSLQRAEDEWLPAVSQSKSRGPGQSVYPKVAPAVVVVRSGGGHGTGFFISPDGWLLTNHHVVSDADVDPMTGSYVAKIHFGQLKDEWMKLLPDELVADVYQWSEEKDLALLKIRKLPENIAQVPFLSLAKNGPAPGIDCVAIGHPASGVLWTLRTGEVAGAAVWPRDRIDTVIAQMSLTGDDAQRLRDAVDGAPQQDVLLSTCGLNPGDSGGPLVNENGELIGVSFAIPVFDEERGVALDKFSYHVSVTDVKRFIESKPSVPLQWQPSPWDSVGSLQLTDFDSNGHDDLLVISDSDYDEPNALLFDLNEDSTLVDFSNDPSLEEVQSRWDSEFVLQTIDFVACYYDTDDDGTLDLYLIDEDQDGIANQVLRWNSTRWVVEEAGSQSMRIVDVAHFQDDVRSQLQAAFDNVTQHLGLTTDSPNTFKDSPKSPK